ncbi:replication factor-a protein [Cerioporus squamosus]|nr:replication factor-a protein [Cerioporus squamosus]
MAGLPQLTTGICARLANSENEDSEELFNSQPTLQLLSFKKVPPTGGGNNVDRYRVIVSDGQHFLQSMLATQLNHLVEEDAISKGAVAVIEKFTCNIVQGKRLLIILALRVLVKTAEKMGSPGPLQGRPEGGSSTPATETPGPSTSTNVTPAPPPAAAAQPARQQTQANRNNRAAAIYPIESLSPYQNHWTIKARAMNKSDIRTWVNQRGEGKLFSVTLMDDSGEIRATAFNAAVDLFYDKIQEGKVYLVSKAKVNLAKKKFSNVNNEYELTFERNTEVEECLDMTDVPTVKFNFVPISGLQDVAKDATCGTDSDIVQIPKRELTVVDRSGYSVRVTLWGKQAEQFEATDQPVIAFKGAKVGDFQGRSLSMMSSSSMHINPDIPEAHALRGWFDAAGSDQTFQAHTSTFTGGGGITFDRAEVRNLNENDTISYPACPTQGCGKKVVELGDSWRCEKCDKSYPKPQHRYMVSMAVSDYSGQAWLSGFNDVGQTIFGMSADELVDIRERDDTQFNQVVERAIGTTYNFACRAKQDSYNETTRVRYAINRIIPLNYREEAKYLANLLTHSDWAR